MISTEDDGVEAAQVVAELISDFRCEWADNIRQSIEQELKEIEDAGFDPAKGRGRGPRWADGG